MPAPQEPQQQAPMEMSSTSAPGVVTQQPASEPQPDMSLRGGEEAGSDAEAQPLVIDHPGTPPPDLPAPNPHPPSDPVSSSYTPLSTSATPDPSPAPKDGGQRSSPIPMPSNPNRPTWSIVINDSPPAVPPSKPSGSGSGSQPGISSKASRFTEGLDIGEGSTSATGAKSKGKGKEKSIIHPLLNISWGELDTVHEQRHEEENEGRGRSRSKGKGKGKDVSGSGTNSIEASSNKTKRSSTRYRYLVRLSPIPEAQAEE
ncbi:hypothetical protein F5Y09DRAFT_337164 [Xylaria sp. FL1042]|nr:hypothetical protein F5Y09DRAFT_337164 [Xylaria sp. FL1042]